MDMEIKYSVNEKGELVETFVFYTKPLFTLLTPEMVNFDGILRFKSPDFTDSNEL